MKSPRRSIRTLASLTTLAGLTFAAACSGDSISQPHFAGRPVSSTLSVQALTALISVTALTRDSAIPTGIERSFTFTQKGGTIDIKETGLRVVVPEGAIPGTSLTIVVTALPGKTVAYDFQPHGTKFLKPLSFQQNLSNTSWDKLGFKGVIQGGYFKSTSQIDLVKGTALLDELFPVLFSSKTISFDINHFSGYMVSSGRSSMTYDESTF